MPSRTYSLEASLSELVPSAEERARRDAQNRLWGAVRFSDPEPLEQAISDVRDLLRQGAKLELVSETGGADGISPLHMAARGGDKRWLAVFQAVGADLNARDARDRSIAEEAAHEGCDDFLMGLHEIGFDLAGHRTGALKCSLLHIAAMRKASTVNVLLSLGCDADAVNDFGARPMHGAHGDPSIMAALLGAGAAISPLNRDFVSPIGMAASTSSAAGFAFLLEQGADPDSLSGGVSIRKKVASIPDLLDILRAFEASQAARSALSELIGPGSP